MTEGTLSLLRDVCEERCLQGVAVITERLRIDKGESLAILFLCALFVFHASLTVMVIHRDNLPFLGDSADQYLRSVRFLKGFANGGSLGALAAFYTHTDDIHPPLFGAVSALFMVVLGVSQDTALLANLPLLFILLVSTYGLGKRMFNRYVGLVAAILVSFFPSAVSISRAYLADYAVAALTPLSLLLLMRTLDGGRVKDAISLGITLGLTALTQPFFSLYLVGPVLLLLIPRLISFQKGKEGPSMRRILLLSGVALFLAALIAMPWYLIHGSSYFQTQGCRMSLLRQNSTLAGRLMIAPPTRILSISVAPFWASLFLIACAVFLVHGMWRGVLISWLCVPYLSFLAVGISGDILLQLLSLSNLPAIAIILGFFLDWLFQFTPKRIPRGMMKTAGIVVLLTIEILMYLVLTFTGSGDLLDPWGRDVVSFDETMIRLSYLGRTSPHRLGFSMALLLERLSDSEKPAEKVFVLNPAGVISHAVMTEAAVRGLDVGFVDCYETQKSSCRQATWEDNRKCFIEVVSSDYVLIEALRPDLRGDEKWWAFGSADYLHKVLPFVEELQAASMNWTGEILPATLLTRTTSSETDGESAWPGQRIMLLAPGDAADNPGGAV